MFCFVPAQCVIENYKKITKKFKNTIKNSFQAKIGWKKMRKRDKNYRSILFRSYPMLKRKFHKNSKKFKNTFMNSYQAKIGWK